MNSKYISQEIIWINRPKLTSVVQIVLVPPKTLNTVFPLCKGLHHIEKEIRPQLVHRQLTYLASSSQRDFQVPNPSRTWKSLLFLDIGLSLHVKNFVRYTRPISFWQRRWIPGSYQKEIIKGERTHRQGKEPSTCRNYLMAPIINPKPFVVVHPNNLCGGSNNKEGASTIKYT